MTDSSHASSISEPALNGLRDQIKKIMIPMLIKIFQFKLEHSQAEPLPSRLSKEKKSPLPQETVDQVKLLDEDLHLLILWCQSCRGQIAKALAPPETEGEQKITQPTAQHLSELLKKSFSDAISSQLKTTTPSRPLGKACDTPPTKSSIWSRWKGWLRS